ncbi:serine/threonine-protein phosphatase 4 regulatory subunit 1 isoform X2 [Rhinatrema bivittatum]|uniref:serine/threonine-protein phosphatase 4 regulatory subunit 1 isoform X2 n=1 Tax=Rhinatrema bivittatum TaxID=194408 RepID=UPI0011267D85|nr:serine/threonine-protein phosphatase 4 regulatory subunit 1 isoform X2 [Rhinatrema bivittatum]
MADATLLLQDELPEEADASLDFVSQDEMLTPLGRLDKYAASENIFNRQMVARSLLDLLKEVSDDERDCIAVLERVNRLADDSDSLPQALGTWDSADSRWEGGSHLELRTEPTVRAELMEQVPHIAMFCQENRPSIPFAFSKYLLPIVVRYLADQNNQVRKTSQAALLVLLEQELIERYDVETKVCPVLIELTAPDSNDDVKTEAVAIMCKMAPMVGKDITERLILPRFCEMCCDCRMFHVRKVCAANFGDICSVVGQEATEEMLLPRFFQLCSDNVWGVRKACAECFMAVSCATSQELRRTKLSTLFINLISDPSRWVRQAAFQSLGPFISTFANPSSSGQYFKEEDVSTTEDGKPGGDCNRKTIRVSGDVKVDASGDVPSEDISDSETEEPSVDNSSVSFTVKLEDEAEDEMKTDESQKETCIQTAVSLECTLPLDSCGEKVDENKPNSRPSSTEAPRKTDFSLQINTVSEQELYNSFHYWRTPIPQIDIDLELLQAQVPEVVPSPECQPSAQNIDLSPSPNITMATRKELEEMLENLEPHIDDPDIKAQVDVLSAALRASNMDTQEDGTAIAVNRKRGYQNELTQEARLHCALIQDDFVPLISEPDESMESALRYIHSESDLSTNNSSPEDGKKSKIQDVVPQALLDQYLSMTDPSRAQTVDTEIAKHCAYSLPGVALTLGRQNWHCLKDTYETLASDMQWKVRRTLAFSIHELAVILGDSLTAADLVPIFNGFLKDLDEVRIGVLKHLYDFLKLLHLDRRREYLYQLQEFLVTDNSRNWRFRAELAEQLILLLDLYNARDIYDYLRPISLSLCADKVSSVRWISYKLVSEMVKKLNMASTPTFAVDLMSELVERFCCSPKWSGRQTFVFICQAVLEDDCLPMDQFAVHLMPHLLHLASDRIPNVRVLLAKTLKQTLLEKEYFLNSANSHQEAVEQTIMALQMDYDNDVKYFASIHPASTKIADDAMSTASSTY